MLTCISVGNRKWEENVCEERERKKKEKEN